MNRKWLILVAGISLALNLVLVGFLVGRTVGDMRPRISVDPTAGVARLIHTLGPERTKELMSQFDSERRGLVRELRQLRALRMRIPAAMAAEPFDGGDLHSLLHEQRMKYIQTLELNDAILVSVFSSMSPEERQQVAASIRTSVIRWKKSREEGTSLDRAKR